MVIRSKIKILIRSFIFYLESMAFSLPEGQDIDSRFDIYLKFIIIHSNNISAIYFIYHKFTTNYLSPTKTNFNQLQL